MHNIVDTYTNCPFFTSRQVPPFKQNAGAAILNEYSGPSVGLHNSMPRFSWHVLPPRKGSGHLHENSTLPLAATVLSQVAPCKQIVLPSLHCSDKCSHCTPPYPRGHSHQKSSMFPHGALTRPTLHSPSLKHFKVHSGPWGVLNSQCCPKYPSRQVHMRGALAPPVGQDPPFRQKRPG